MGRPTVVGLAGVIMKSTDIHIYCLLLVFVASGVFYWIIGEFNNTANRYEIAAAQGYALRIDKKTGETWKLIFDHTEAGTWKKVNETKGRIVFDK